MTEDLCPTNKKETEILDYRSFGDKLLEVNPETGEIGRTFRPVENGSIIYTPEQQEAYRKRKEIEKEKRLRRDAQDELGYFYFVKSNMTFSDLIPETATKLVYLNTYLDYNNRLMLSERRQMQKKDLEDVLKISPATMKRFWKSVSPKYIINTKDGLMSSCPDIIRGDLPKVEAFQAYQKFYLDGIRKLYAEADNKHHKHLGYVFQLLPYVNIEYNILCFNPFEKNLTDIRPMSVKDFCQQIGYDNSHLNRLLSLYGKIRFDVDGKPQQFCAFSYDGLHREEMLIFVNPHIFYGGSDFRKVEVLGKFCYT